MHLQSLRSQAESPKHRWCFHLEVMPVDESIISENLRGKGKVTGDQTHCITALRTNQRHFTAEKPNPKRKSHHTLEYIIWHFRTAWLVN